MRNVLRLCLGLLFFLAASDLSIAGDSVNPLPPDYVGASKCSVSSNPSQNTGTYINFFGGDICQSSGSGTIAPRCDGTYKPL